ncbi:hypothetical protein K438DRAFT_1774147 [Mycena galopus ATCC 62051]|nr:hypothetical protein K438DRAFT_1774147 [Mycena galopus ATCC 62051]
MPRLFVYMCENAFVRPPRTPISLEEWSPAGEHMGREDRLRSRSLRLPPVPTRMRIAVSISSRAKEKLGDVQARLSGAERVQELDEEPEHFQSGPKLSHFRPPEAESGHDGIGLERNVRPGLNGMEKMAGERNGDEVEEHLLKALSCVPGGGGKSKIRKETRGG